jgi:hypothetical protein
VPRDQVISKPLIGELDAGDDLRVMPPHRSREKTFLDELTENFLSLLPSEREARFQTEDRLIGAEPVGSLGSHPAGEASISLAAL